MVKLVNKHILPNTRLIFFNEEAHSYTDDLENKYTSVTTLIGKYHSKFDSINVAKACERIGRNPKHPKYEKYKNKTAKQILKEWELETERACDKGSTKHNYLEDTIKNVSNYKKNAKGFINDRIYTIDDIIREHNYGRVNLSRLESMGLKVKYPKIFTIIEKFTKQGFKIYSEIGVYNYHFLISGLVDILLVRGDEFIILDWKTNKAPIRFESGYYDKNLDGTLRLDKFILKDDKMSPPISHLADSVGIHYTLQLSLYANLIERFGLKCRALLLCHIRTEEGAFDEYGKPIEHTELYKIDYLKEETDALLSHHLSVTSRNGIDTLF